jgi:hypothetical protein
MAERESLKHANQLSEEIKGLIRGRQLRPSRDTDARWSTAGRFCMG